MTLLPMFSFGAIVRIAFGMLSRARPSDAVRRCGDDARHTRDDREVGMGDPWPMPASVGHVVTLPGTCWRCGANLAPIVGVLVMPKDGSAEMGFIPFAVCAQLLAATLSPTALSGRGVGALRLRASRIGGRYMSNGCPSCNAIQGNFHLEERLLEYEQEGHTLVELPRIAQIELPPALLVAGWNMGGAPKHSYTILDFG